MTVNANKGDVFPPKSRYQRKISKLVQDYPIAVFASDGLNDLLESHFFIYISENHTVADRFAGGKDAVQCFQSELVVQRILKVAKDNMDGKTFAQIQSARMDIWRIAGSFYDIQHLSARFFADTLAVVNDKGIALTITNQTPVSVPHPVLQAINNIKLFNIFPIVFFFFLLLAVLTELFLRKTQFGRNLYLVGGNINVADNLGLKSRNYLWSAYIFQGLYAAIGGVVMMTRQFSASGNLALQGPMEVIPMVIVGGTSMAGGRGGAIKTVWGVVLLKIIYNAMTMFSIPAPLQPFVKGLILLAVIVSDKYMERRHEKI